ncbi:hypothetical protein LSTR_LSTR017335 [Laodelphax striatellus]|uniref:Uncharacterized protein n=1 Tax=Laodelphax striatellus TaxID=195883 RepID=A0A482WH54_LAOST|nr:hypothetical protein LSTR_LSTR017335 [Laodelphax striatellus]
MKSFEVIHGKGIIREWGAWLTPFFHKKPIINRLKPGKEKDVRSLFQFLKKEEVTWFENQLGAATENEEETAEEGENNLSNSDDELDIPSDEEVITAQEQD